MAGTWFDPLNGFTNRIITDNGNQKQWQVRDIPVSVKSQRSTDKPSCSHWYQTELGQAEKDDQRNRQEAENKGIGIK